MMNSLKDTDFHEWAMAAKKVLETREVEDAPLEDLERQADDFLRQAGINPKNP